MRLPLLIGIALITYLVRSFKIFTEEHQLKVFPSLQKNQRWEKEKMTSKLQKEDQKGGERLKQPHLAGFQHRVLIEKDQQIPDSTPKVQVENPNLSTAGPPDSNVTETKASVQNGSAQDSSTTELNTSTQANDTNQNTSNIRLGQSSNQTNSSTNSSSSSDNQINWGLIFGIGVPVGALLGGIIGVCAKLMRSSDVGSFILGAFIGALVVTVVLLIIYLVCNGGGGIPDVNTKKKQEEER